MEIRRNLIRYNYSSRRGKEIKYIVIHDTGNTSRGAGAYNHYKYFDSGNRRASAHYFVDDHEIIQTVDDSKASWHCGDGKGKYGITNQNSIGIEICINSDGDYEKALEKTVELVKYLMKKYNLTIDSVKRHYDASRKVCPQTMSKAGWKKWHDFKERISKVETYYRVMAGSYRVRANADNQVERLKEAGFDATIMVFNKS